MTRRILTLLAVAALACAAATPVAAQAVTQNSLTSGPATFNTTSQGITIPINGNAIGRITPAGLVTEFSAGITPISGPEGITAGPDGNLWFCEFRDGKVAMINPTTALRPGTFRSGPVIPIVIGAKIAEKRKITLQTWPRLDCTLYVPKTSSDDVCR